MLAIVAPGQGAQTPGFLAPWLVDQTFADRLNWLSTVAGLDLTYYGTEADAETIRDTAIAQPRFAMGEVAAKLLLDRIDARDAPARSVTLAPTMIVRNSVQHGV